MRITDTRNATGIASSQHTRFRYDIFDRVTEVRSLDPQGRTLSLELTTYFDINDNEGNRRILTTTVGGPGTPGASGTAFAPTIQHAPDIQTFVQYDRFGRRTREDTIGGQIFAYTHDIAGRVVTEQALGFNSATSTYSILGVSNTFTHNIFGIATVRNINGHTSHNTYDSMGRLMASTDFMGNTQRFTYDALGRLIRQDTPFERIGATTHYA